MFLKMTGDDNFTQIHIEAALEQCSVFVVLNITFQEAEPEVTYTIETFCQNNCSRHGICNAGKLVKILRKKMITANYMSVLYIYNNNVYFGIY